jgi:basic membrane lipoprotein Med (substrate-binding protein (PBP1-ABC) superfamily)
VTDGNVIAKLSRYCLAVVATVVLVSCADRQTSSGFKVALITPGSIADAAWNSAAYQGLLRIRDSLGADVSHVEAGTPASQEEALRTYAAQGYDLIIGNGFEFQEPSERVSEQYPRPVFAVNSGARLKGRVVPLVFQIQEATYLAGMVAGGLTKSGIIGFVGGVELPPVAAGYRGWVNGARAVRPDIQSRVSYLNNWDDAAAGREAALAQIRLGADMIHHNADAAALGVFQAVKESPNVYIFGANADQRALAPERVIGSAVIDLPHAFLLLARAVKDSTFTPQVESFGLKSEVLRYVPNPALDSLVPDALMARVKAAADSIANGTLNPDSGAPGS